MEVNCGLILMSTTFISIVSRFHLKIQVEINLMSLFQIPYFFLSYEVAVSHPWTKSYLKYHMIARVKNSLASWQVHVTSLMCLLEIWPPIH